MADEQPDPDDVAALLDALDTELLDAHTTTLIDAVQIHIARLERLTDQAAVTTEINDVVERAGVILLLRSKIHQMQYVLDQLRGTA